MRIALFLPNWIGDVVMATPAIRAVRERHPQAHLVAVGRPYVEAVLQGSPWFNETVSADRGAEFRMAAHLRKQSIDCAILFPNSFRSAFIAWLARCRARIGFARYLRDGLLTQRLYAERDEQGNIRPTPILASYNQLVEKAGCPVNSLNMELFTTVADERAADEVWHAYRFNRFDRVVCINPGAAFGAAKLWPAESFAELARRLVDRNGCAVLVLCGPAERPLADRIATLAGRDTVRSLSAHPPSIGLTKACIRRSSLLVTTDSGPRHFAAAFRRPVVSLFGPTHVEWTDTFYDGERVLQKRLPCGPCQQRVCPEGHHRCMVELTVDEVESASRALIERSWRARHAG